MNIENWQKANEIYGTLTHLDQVGALEKLKTIENITPEIKKIVTTLISSADQTSQYFEQQVGEDYTIKSIIQSSWQPGKEIGDYQLIKEIGEGGMSKVFSAKRKNSDVQKLVAIKIFSHSTNSKELKKRFIEEQKILSGLSHSNIITMHHGETTESGEPYIVMELITNAIAVDEYVENKKSSIQEKIQFILDTADALSYAHRNLVVHRDIKPSNIIVSENGTVKIVDFGIAKQISNVDNNENTIMALTPSFASPEQINGKSINIYTDIFSLAAVGIAIITEENPLPTDRLIKSCEGDDDYVRQKLKNHKTEKDLSNILIQAIANDPNKRYKNMDKFAEDLNAWLNNETVSATPDSLMYRLSKFAKRRKALFASILTLIFSMAIAVSALSWQYKKTKIEAQKALQVKQFMLDAFRVTDPNANQGVEISAKDLLKIASDNLSENKQLEDNIKFDLHQTIAIAYGQLGFFNYAIENINKSLVIKPNNSKSLSLMCEYLLHLDRIEELKNKLTQFNYEQIQSIEDKNRILRVIIRLHVLNGEFELADQLMKGLNNKTINSEDYIENQRLKGEIAFVKGDVDVAIGIINDGLSHIDLKPSHTLILGMKNDLIIYLNKIGRYDEALNINEEIIVQLRLVLGDRHPDLGNSLNQLSSTYRLKGNMESAFNAASDAQQIFFSLYGENSIGFAQSNNKLAMLEYLNGNKDEAIDGFEKTVKIYETIYSTDHLETLKVKVSLAGLYTAIGKFTEAESLLQKVYQIQKDKLGESHSSTLNTQQHLARALTALNNLTEAIYHAEKNYELVMNNYNISDPVVDASEFILAKTYFKAQEYKQALDVFLKREEKYDNKNSHTYANLLWDIAKSYVALEEPEQADSYFLKSIKAYDNVYSPEHIRSLRIRLIYASFLLDQNRISESKTTVESVVKTYQAENHDEPRLLSMIDKLNKKFTQNHF